MSEQSVPGSLVSWETPGAESPGETQGQGPAGDLERLREEARESGLKEGYAAGVAAAEAAISEQADALRSVLQALARPLQNLDRQVETELVELVRAVARQLVRRELRTDPGEVVSVIRACLDALPSGAFDVVVKLHPQDAALVRERLQPNDGETPWRIQADPILDRGSCQISSTSSQVDGRLETRLGRIIAELFDDQRDQHPSSDD